MSQFTKDEWHIYNANLLKLSGNERRSKIRQMRKADEHKRPKYKKGSRPRG